MIADEHGADRDFVALLDQRGIHMVFQPVVDLDSGEVVALEAFARGPEGSTLEFPHALFAAARRVGRVAELDWACRAAAFKAVLESEIPPAMSLFVNVEPEAIAAECPADLSRYVSRAEATLRVFVEMTDRALVADPAGVLAAVDRAREMGWGIAIDDVGASRAPLAMFPIVRADLIKLDLRRLEQASPHDASAIITSLLRHVEMTGATLLVKGIESEEDARRARALGAAYGQGMHLGDSGPLWGQYTAPRIPVPLIKVAEIGLDIDSPFELLTDRPHQTMERAELDLLARLLALSPRSAGTWPVFLSCVGRDATIPELITRNGLPEETLLFVTFGTNLRRDPFPGMLGVKLALDDALADERFLIMLSDQAPVAIFARPAQGGAFDVVVSQDPELVHPVAHYVIARVPGPGRSNAARSGHRRVVEQPVPFPLEPEPPHRRSWLGLRAGAR